MKALFPLGQICATPGAIEALEQVGLPASNLLTRHVLGDDGELCREDKQTNRDALKTGARIFSSYKINDQLKIWIITEADRSVTTLLLPEEY